MQFGNRIQANPRALTARLSSQQSQGQGEAAQQKNLSQGQTQTIQARPNLVVRATSGILWLTQQGDTQDIILRSGQQWTATRAGQVVVQALETDATWTMRNAKTSTTVLKWLPLFGHA